MRNEILKKAQMYETSILNPSVEIRSNINEARATPDSSENDEKMNLLMSTPLHYSDNVNSLLKPHCNRSGVHISIKGTNFCDIIIPNHPDDKEEASNSEKQQVRSIQDAEKHRSKQREKTAKYQENNDKEKAILDETIQSMISIDKL